jgi:hypothetical protein
MLPTAFVPLTLLVFLLMPVRPTIFGVTGVLCQLSGLLQILPGFYIASLAAIATFNLQNMDHYLPKPTPTVRVRISGAMVSIQLTRRRMLSFLFGYLTFLSLALFLLTIIANSTAPSLKLVLPKTLHTPTIATFIVLYGTLFWHMIAVTLFGLYQLSDRMHQPDQK